jgi:hypothetical protein
VHPAEGAVVVRSDAPVAVAVRLRWSDGTIEEREARATQWAWPGDGTMPVVHVRVDGAPADDDLEGWYPSVDVRLLGP